MRLLGFVMDLDGRGAATATIVVGVAAVAELKSGNGAAAKVERGRDQLMLVDVAVQLYTPVYIGTLPSPTGFWRFPDRILNICRTSWISSEFSGEHTEWGSIMDIMGWLNI